MIVLALNEDNLIHCRIGSIKKGNRHSEILMRDVEVLHHTLAHLDIGC